MKSMRMNCPSVIVFVKYALPRQIALTAVNADQVQQAALREATKLSASSDA